MAENTRWSDEPAAAWPPDGVRPPVVPLWPLSLVLALVTTAGLFALAVYTWRSRNGEGGGSFLLLILAVGLWVLGSGLAHAEPDLALKFLLAKVSWIGIVMVPPSALVVALHAAGEQRFTRRPHLVALSLPALAILTLVFSNQFHGWMWPDPPTIQRGALTMGHGPAFWISVAYHYVLMLLASGLLVNKYLAEWPRNKEEAALVGMALAAPWLANVRFLLNESQPAAIDLTPYAFSVTAICLSLALWRGHGVLNVIRVGRSQILDEMGDGALVVDGRDRLVYANRAAQQALSIRHPAAPVAVETVLAGHPDLLHALAAPALESQEISIHHPTRGWRTLDLRVTTLESFEGIRTSRVLVLRDVTESRHAQSALRDSEVLLRKVIDLVPHMIFAKDREGRFLLANRTMAASSGTTPEKLLGRRVVPEDPEPLLQYEQNLAEDRLVIDTGEPRHHDEVVWRYRDGGKRTYQVSKIPFVDPGSGDPSMLCIAIDVTERKQTEERMRALAFYDGLTGLPNRQRFQDLLEKTLATARRRQRRVALLFLDLDRFKQVNDRLGHAQGDLMLRTVAERLGDCVRFGDQIVRPGSSEKASTVSRLGGDEFTILLSDVTDPLDAAVVAQRLLASVCAPVTVGNQEVRPTASIGIALFPDDAEDADTLFHHADEAMYSAKRAGRDRYAFFRPAMTEASARRSQIEQGLEDAVGRGQLALHYQPMRHARTGLLLGAEALLRWDHPELGPVSPQEFLPVAEETGWIVPLGEWVLETACLQLREWRDAGLSDLPLSVNLSGFQLRQKTLVEFVSRVLEDTGTSPGQLELEITESTVMSDDDQSRETLRSLKDVGVSFALDDFGTGYSSLGYLRRFPFDVVKIDRSFVQDIVTDNGARVLTGGLIHMAHGLGLRVVAEGVETQEQLDCLRDADCDAIQGHLISPPLPADAFARYLAEDKADPDA